MSFSLTGTSLDDPLNRPLTPVVEDQFRRIYQGNALKILDVLPRSSVSLVVTSPPYPGVSQPEENYITFLDPMDFNKAHDDLQEVWKVCYDLLEDLGRLCINIYDIPTGEQGMYPNVAGVIKRCLEIGFVLRDKYIWKKSASYSPPSGSWPYPKGVLSANTYEEILVFQKPLQFSQRRKDPSDYPAEVRKMSELGKDEHNWLMDNVWTIPVEREGRKLGHPFTYPSELVERLVRLYSYARDIVFDPFLGSGTSVLAAAKFSRIGVGTELSDEYIEICKKRTAQESLF